MDRDPGPDPLPETTDESELVRIPNGDDHLEYSYGDALISVSRRRIPTPTPNYKVINIKISKDSEVKSDLDEAVVDSQNDYDEHSVISVMVSGNGDDCRKVTDAYRGKYGDPRYDEETKDGQNDTHWLMWML
ncbi:MAG: hypothetical protein ACM3KH_00245 [Thiobacillus sp.]